MSGGDYVFDPKASQAAEERVETAAANLQTSVESLSQQLQSLAGSWDASEKAQYDGVHQKVSGGLETMTRTLTQIRNTLGDNSQNVASMRTSVLSTITDG
ncbi:MAG: WXG100 family type VII secretion target [Gordonia amarae]